MEHFKKVIHKSKVNTWELMHFALWLFFAHQISRSRGASVLGFGMDIWGEKRGSAARHGRPKRYDVLFPKINPEPALPNCLRPLCHSHPSPHPSTLLINIPSIPRFTLGMEGAIVTGSCLLCDNIVTVHTLTWTSKPVCTLYPFFLSVCVCMCVRVCVHWQEFEKENNFGLERKVDFS